jgi:hypothetical protein
MVDTAGAASTTMRLRVPYLPEADARALVARLRERLPESQGTRDGSRRG